MDGLVFWGRDDTFVTAGNDVLIWNDASGMNNHAPGVVQEGGLPQVSSGVYGKPAMGGAYQGRVENLALPPSNEQTYLFVGSYGNQFLGTMFNDVVFAGQYIWRRFDNNPDAIVVVDGSNSEYVGAIPSFGEFILLVRANNAGANTAKIRLIQEAQPVLDQSANFGGTANSTALQFLTDRAQDSARHWGLGQLTMAARWNKLLTDEEYEQATAWCLDYFGVTPA